MGYEERVVIMENNRTSVLEESGLMRVHLEYIYVGQGRRGVKIYSTDLEFKH